MSIRVVLAEDNYLLRAGTAALLQALDDVELLAAVADGEALLAAVEEHRPDVVITDIRMPPGHSTEGLAAAAAIRERYPGTGVILLTQFADPQYAYEFLRAGASGAGYLLKERIGDIAELQRSLHQVAAGGSALDPQLVEALVTRRERAEGSPLATLTRREREVLEQMAQGKNNATIAKSLFLTERAVQKHINTLFAKLGLGDSVDMDRRVAAVLTLLDSKSQHQ
ncbi:response regulator transcription factor [Actinocrinis sp.]|uniref:response regulator transcription factor n=1 Tax=Actinocrinis sp. TaxID=1920516 RepID=UPI002D3C5252|nr:response regulator transcription factor [Actinocrinis sp.]HZP55052.1 response regulator transcription factor [Actinocrinis sp.]